MPKIVALASSVPPGAVVTGYATSTTHPQTHLIRPCNPTTLSRIYRGFGQLRAETGTTPRRGFGTLIGNAQLADRDLNRGLKLYLQVED